MTKANSLPAATLEGRERQLVSLAVDQAEKLLMEGKAPTAVLVHYLKLGASDYPLQKERLMRQNELMTAKTEAINRQEGFEELYNNAIEAMQRYSGSFGQEEFDGELP